jgi:4-hydroxythreonine-4-phosphate dehydrogenase
MAGNDHALPIGITLGDPAGIGPEVILKALASSQVDASHRYVVIGSSAVLERALAALPMPIEIVVIEHAADARLKAGVIHVLETPAAVDELPPVGMITAASGEASVSYLRAAVSLIEQGQLSGLVTAPINKQSVQAAGYEFIDQAEFFAKAMSVDPESVTTLVGSGALRAFLVTKHIPLAQVSAKLTPERIVHVGELADRTIRAVTFSIQPAALAVASLNPHAGDGGLIGREEIDVIAPAVETLRRKGVNAIGPMPGKSAFKLMMGGRVQGVIAMYHDQTAPIELHSGSAYTVTLGLPIVRTSVGHGTAHDIAGKGIADPESLLQAISVTTKLVQAHGR